MKVLALVLALALFANLGFAQDTYELKDTTEAADTAADTTPEWVSLKRREYRSGLVKDLLDDGLDSTIDLNIANGALSNTDFDLDSISSVEKQTVEDGTNYRFTVVIDDDEVKGKAVYTVFHPKSGKDVLTSNAIEFFDRSKQGEAGASAGQNAWGRVSLSKFHDSDTMQDAFDDGLNYIIKQGIAHEILPDTTFEVSEPSYIAKVKVSGGTKYRFQVAFSSEEGTAKTSFVIKGGKVLSWVLDHTDVVIPEDIEEAPQEEAEAPEVEADESAPEAPEESEVETRL